MRPPEELHIVGEDDPLSRLETVPPDRKHVVISVNPTAGRGSAARHTERLAVLARREGMQVEILSDLAQVSQRANELHDQRRLRALVGVGGDGTAAELANRTSPGVPLTLLPAGTSNLSARQLGLTERPRDALRTIMAGRTVRLDAGSACGRLFLTMLGCGFDAEVVRRLHDLRRQSAGGNISYWTYLKPIFESIRKYEYPEIRAQFVDECGEPPGGRHESFVARWAFAFNLPRYGWGVRFARRASATDGFLDFVAFCRGGFWPGLRYLAAIEMGCLERLPDCLCRRARRIRLVSSEPVPYQLDGDPGGWLPVEVEVLPGRVTVVVPPE